jgi:hypothetical protein
MWQRSLLLGVYFVAPLLAGCASTPHGLGRVSLGAADGQICTRDGRAVLVLLVDDGLTSSACGSGPGGYHGELTTRSGRKIAWRCTTADGKTGTVTIAGVDFDLAQGPLFLIVAQEAAPRVRQLPADLAPAPGDSADAFLATLKRLESLAASNETVKAFVKGAEEKKDKP